MFHMWDIPAGMGWWMAFGGLWMVVFWGGLIALIVWGIMRLTRRSNSAKDFGARRLHLGQGDNKI